MRVFTHYNEDSQGNGCRWRTLLQFGDSWEIIGSVVMKNPGSANFLMPDRKNIQNETLLNELNKFDTPSYYAPWYEFRADHTMRCVERLFKEYRMERELELKGVIQIFNIFYLKGVDLAKTMKIKERIGYVLPECFECEEEMVYYDLTCLKPPVYLGFSTLSCHPDYKKRAKSFYDRARELGMEYLNVNYAANKFIHPMYMMGVGSKRPDCELLREAFIINRPISADSC